MNKWMLGLLLVVGCSETDKQATDANTPVPVDATTLDAASCQLSGGCDWIVSAASECPDVINTNFCEGVCGGGECCWCEGTVAQVEFIDCTDGCVDAGM